MAMCGRASTDAFWQFIEDLRSNRLTSPENADQKLTGHC